FGKPEELRKLEKIIHPLVRKVQLDFLKQASWRGEKLVVLDIPLLFETGGEKRVDATVVVSAPLFLQRQRVLARPGMSEEKFEQVLAQQVPDHEKRRKADFIVPSGLGLSVALREVRRIITLMRDHPGGVWPYGVLSRL
ncbi:MAG: dephospho-CoA kinase, partial [Alphaproteobacteria bacterium]|nr:dephospho-CoA kinase [Alphaproteobacteria bacterium]